MCGSRSMRFIVLCQECTHLYASIQVVHVKINDIHNNTHVCQLKSLRDRTVAHVYVHCM